ncbi:glycerophosphodiester phosphodiesterase [Paenibacillus sp. TRM 82003]|uniref:glycerophosphodiester phosphodiesterase n=1 Tax=Kineococcus sp. TRM81007 TaxID=2925831 RepID=UPI001F5A2CA0|nr:glycerophosphodiester phosphodiesterase [Kineococcus sp. TRM81007]MCI2239847.1 glycerophosphodiester phosphodiesterase [Kineococcus sp. TRM81007]MCI3925850.1 glycerophosphodiester phosphodiesterase [Paenibacillus sp. TRM 82003]
MRSRTVAAATLAAATVLTPLTAASAAPDTHPGHGHGHEQAAPLIVGHRGASAYRPEHTLAAYELAAELGADVIEPDLVATKDGVLVVRHENEISGTTDVEERPEFADRQATKTIDGVELTGWFTEDFTLAELKTLRAEERLPELRQESTIFDGAYEVPTFEEVLDERERLSEELDREIGIIPEIKHSTYFQSIGLPMEEEVVEALTEHGLNRPGSGATVQSFELTNLVELRTELGLRADSVFLTSASGAPADLVAAGDPRQYADLLLPSTLRDIARYVDAIGPSLTQVVALEEDGTLGEETRLVADAHAAGLEVVPYTLRPENEFLPVDYRSSEDPAEFGRVLDLAQVYFEAGIDGIFTDSPDLGVVARDRFLAQQDGEHHAG